MATLMPIITSSGLRNAFQRQGTPRIAMMTAVTVAPLPPSGFGGDCGVGAVCGGIPSGDSSGDSGFCGIVMDETFAWDTTE